MPGPGPGGAGSHRAGQGAGAGPRPLHQLRAAARTASDRTCTDARLASRCSARAWRLAHTSCWRRSGAREHRVAGNAQLLREALTLSVRRSAHWCSCACRLPCPPTLVAARDFRRSVPPLPVPDAILRFRQGFGRLIRSKTDRGVVVILDKRGHVQGVWPPVPGEPPEQHVQRGSADEPGAGREGGTAQSGLIRPTRLGGGNRTPGRSTTYRESLCKGDGGQAAPPVPDGDHVIVGARTEAVEHDMVARTEIAQLAQEGDHRDALTLPKSLSSQAWGVDPLLPAAASPSAG